MTNKLKLAAAAATMAIGLATQAASAWATTCTGSPDIRFVTEVLFNATSDTCTIQNSSTFTGTDNTFSFFVRPDDDSFFGVKDGGFGGGSPADSMFVNGSEVTGIVGIFRTLFNNDISGLFVAVVIAELFDVTYKMTVNLNGNVGGGTGIAIESASVERVSDVPVPAALPLLASAVAGAGFLARRRRKQAALTA
jgi:hypothetical protein